MKTKKQKAKRPAKKAAETEAEVKPACCVVGVGSSAGGLEALRSLFGALQPTKNLSFVVVQHLSPVHRSRLVELIGHSTNLQVKEVQNGIIPRPGIVYITPPNKDVRIQAGKLLLQRPAAKVGPKPSVDLFFKSLAEDSGKDAVGIVLSGTGSDGALGIRAIKSVGGVTISQKSNSAKYDGMPRSASHTGMVDLELTPEEIAAELSRIDQLDLRANRTSPDAGTNPEDPLRDILKILSEQKGVSFDLYKQNTIRRRVERRINATNSATARDYATYLRANPGEAQNLIQDILISVTSFFRDAESFLRLQKILTARLKQKPSKGGFRAWVVGCATGEEAYSIAILLSEAMQKNNLGFRPKIFATDLDEVALEFARRGVYPRSAFSDFPPEWQEKYFVPKDDRFQVRAELRDMVNFAKHDITDDPPFLDIDLLTCRNVMIYFTPVLQNQVLHTFQYALNERGLLFLGRSETVSSSNKNFEVVDKQHRFYERNGYRGDVRAPQFKRDLKLEPLKAPRTSREPREDEYFFSLLASFAPDSVIIDEEFHVKQVFGRAGLFLQLPPGKVTQEITKLVPPALGFELSSLIRGAQKSQKATQGRLHGLKVHGKQVHVKTTVAPLHAEGRLSFLVCFAVENPKDKKSGKAEREAKMPKDARVQKLNQELIAAREHLQTVIEEQETSNEELQALNEELQSANEELQSTNEELETTNEELQSTNEELITLNEEVNVKGTELMATNLELQASQNAISYPLIVIDRKNDLVRFNSAARQLFRMTDGDLGRPVGSGVNSINFSPISLLVEKALKENGEARQQLQALNRSFEVQVRAIRNFKKEVEGHVISFVDNTEIVRALEESRTYRERLSNILENTLALVSMKDISGEYIYVNRKFLETTGKSREEIIGRTDEEIFGAEVGSSLRENDLLVMKRKSAIQSDEFLPIGDSGIHWAASRFPLFDRQGRVQSICIVGIDISDRVKDQRTISNQQEELARYGKFSAIAEISAGIAHEVNTPLNVITTKSDLMQRLADQGKLDTPTVHRLANDVKRMAKNISSIVLGLKSVAGLEVDKAEEVSLQSVVGDALKICEFRLQRFAIKVHVELPNEELVLRCFPVQIIQVLINLINNSIDAMKDFSDRWIRISIHEIKNDYCLRVTDAGHGIPEDIAEKIMTPFFTTKKKEQGTGIGLSLSRSIARRHGGDLELDNTQKNTSFLLRVPKEPKMMEEDLNDEKQTQTEDNAH